MKWRIVTHHKYGATPMLYRMSDMSGTICGWNDAADWRKQNKTSAREAALYVLLVGRTVPRDKVR